MGLNLVNLTGEVRRYMLEEIEMDIASAKGIYLSTRLNERGIAAYPNLLKTASQDHNDDWLADQIENNGLLNAREQKRKPKGGFTWADVPYTAPETLAEGEFNRFYARALCRHAIDSGVGEVVVYRAKAVMNARSASEAKIGTRINAHVLLNDLRTHQGMDTALGLPPGPNSGLSVRLP